MKRLIAMLICSCVLFAGINLTAEKPETSKPVCAAKKSEAKVCKKGEDGATKCDCKYKKRKGKQKLVKKCDECKKKTPVTKTVKQKTPKGCTCAKCANKKPTEKCKKECKCAKCKKVALVKQSPVKKCGKDCKCPKCATKEPKKCDKGCKCPKCANKVSKKTPTKEDVEVIVLPEIKKEKQIPRFIENEIPPGMEKGSEKGQEKKKESGNAWWKFW